MRSSGLLRVQTSEDNLNPTIYLFIYLLFLLYLFIFVFIIMFIYHDNNGMQSTHEQQLSKSQEMLPMITELQT